MLLVPAAAADVVTVEAELRASPHAFLTSTHSVLAVVPAGHEVVAATASPLTDPADPKFAAPEVEVASVRTGHWHGYDVAMLVLRGPQGTRVQVTLETSPAASQARRRLRFDAQQMARIRESIGRHVANPADLARFAPPAPTVDAARGQRGAKSAPGGFRPTFGPSLEGSGVRHLIVTSEALAPAFETLADWRTRRGLPSQVRTIEWIESRTRRGIDRAETIRNFLVEAYELWGIEWVLLGGDTPIIPARLGRSLVYSGTPDEYIPSDLYYSCLDGTWNDDGDASWGEGATQEDPSEADIMPEVHLARLPVETSSEVTLFLNKLQRFELPVFDDYQQNMALLHEVLAPANWDSGQTITYDGADAGEDMMTNSVPPAMTALRLYDSYWMWPGAERLSKAAALDLLNQGASLVNHLGHGYRYNMSVGDASIVNGDADLLTNVDRNFLLVMANCTAVAFDYDCLAEHYLMNPAGGASGVIGASRSVSALFVVHYSEALIRQLFEYDQSQLSTMLDGARLERAAIAVGDNQDRQLTLALNALGDPAMPVFTGPVRHTAVAHVDTVYVGTDSLQVTVSADSLPAVGATVCAMKDGEVYAVVQTDSAGTGTLAIAPQTPGALLLNVSGTNMTSVEDTVTVLPVTPAFVRVFASNIDDDPGGPGFGNGDGRIDAGETIDLSLDVENTGGTTAMGVLVEVIAADAGLSVLADSLMLATLPPDSVQAAEGSIVVVVDAGVADGATLDLQLRISAQSGGTWDHRLPITVCAPRLEVMRIDTQLVTKPGASGAMTVMASKTLQVEIKNYGSGELPAVVGTLTSADSSTTVTQDSTGLTPLAGLSTATMTPPFAIDVPDSGGGSALLDLVDAYGRQTQLVVDLQPPGAPAPPTADPTFSANTMRLVWTPSADMDLLGYHVFRAPLGGSFQRLTPDIVLHADYRDGTVAANSKYEYYTVAVDSSRQWGAASDTVQINTTVAALPGWPLQLDDPTSSSVAVGDLDGDSQLEVVVGAVGVYAWHHDGQEVVDGDSIPATFGILFPGVGTMNASVALGEFDGAPGLEVVAAPWFSNAMYVLDAAGAVLPGWPQTPANGGNPGYWASPVVGDVDNDGSNEIVAISKDGWLYAWHADGSPLVPATDGKVRFVGGWTQNTPALADLDDNDDLEIVVATSAGSLLVVGPDGTDDPGWPVHLLKAIKASPVVGDVDADGTLEIVVTSTIDLLFAFKPDGTPLSGFPVSAPSRAPDFGPSPALGDLTGDGRLEIVVPIVPPALAATELRVYDYQGNIILAKLLGDHTQMTPLLADLDGDGGLDIVAGGEAGVLHAWDAAGNDLDGFPIVTGDFARSTPTYTDVDLDGIGDLVFAGWNRNVYIWQMVGPYRRDRAPWPAFHGNVQRTGALPADFPTATVDGPPAALRARWFPNPFNPSVTLQLGVPGDRPVPVRVDVFDIRGHRVRRLLHGMQPPGSLRVVWDGRDTSGRALASGVYLYRVQVDDEQRAGKITLVR